MYQSINNTNFQGGFYVKAPNGGSFNSIIKEVTSMTQSHKICRDFNGNKNTMFIATPPKIDGAIKKIISILGLEYKYYPQIDPWMNNLKSNSGLRRLLSRLVIKNEQIIDILNLIGIRQGNYALLAERNGAKIIRNTANNNYIHISPEARNRTRYVKILPGQSQSDATSRYFAVRDGHVHEFKKIDDISNFNKKYNGTLIRTNISEI